MKMNVITNIYSLNSARILKDHQQQKMIRCKRMIKHVILFFFMHDIDFEVFDYFIFLSIVFVVKTSIVLMCIYVFI